MHSRARAWTPVLSLPLLVAIGCSPARPAPTPPPRPTPAPSARPRAIQGLLHDGFTGRPIESGEVVLEGIKKRKTVLAARLGAGGRFRFDDVPGEMLFVKWRPDETARKQVLGVKPAGPVEDDLLDIKEKPTGSCMHVELPAAETSDLDLGEVNVWAGAMARRVFGPACQTGRRVDTMPAIDFVALERDRESAPFGVDDWPFLVVAPAWPKSWKGVVCITATRRKMGTYRTLDGHGDTSAYRVTWQVRVVRLPDGREFHTTFTADPPEHIKLDSTGSRVEGYGDVDGDPEPQLHEWLARIQRQG